MFCYDEQTYLRDVKENFGYAEFNVLISTIESFMENVQGLLKA